MTEQQEDGVSIVDIVSETRYQASFALRTYFGTDDIKELEDYVPVVNAMQQLPEQLIDDVGVKIVSRFFEDESLDPKKRADRAVAAPFVPLMVTSISTALQAIYQSVQQQEAQKARTKSKLLQPLR